MRLVRVGPSHPGDVRLMRCVVFRDHEAADMHSAFVRQPVSRFGAAELTMHVEKKFCNQVKSRETLSAEDAT